MDRDAAVKYMLTAAQDDRHGYSQPRRKISANLDEVIDGDCSSFVIGACRAGGLDTGEASYTGDMLKPLLAAGLIDATSSVNLRTGDGLRKGDILLRPKTSQRGGHTAMYIGDGLIAHAVSDYDRKPGDSSGREIRVQKYYDSPFRYVLRWPEERKEPTGAIGVVVNCRLWCNRREKPTSASRKVGEARPGDQIMINGKRMVNGKVWYHDSIGNWICSDYVDINDSAVPWM